MLDKDMIRKIAKNAKVELTEEETKEFLPQIEDVLEWFKAIENAPDMEMSMHPIKIRDAFRDDIVEQSMPKEYALQGTDHKKDGYFKGPRAV
ncbi:Asp-tRNA(Asn)/Glu-tRNA(Gln) amidotransferase GatCAB subunit C [Candidatus Woesearchaeota archaeon CG11_big_fil_rev_8_21_14_0_20_43_8]|nr:MAG: Asp-tRNA(Asn)/Glu-tRNA(Gln) amidotransferase GatCAB subunit C [Candidatus Woesearchaeota archaeon CG11_big_fil_rev_8_21_14_0_20_43_8]